ncbi:MAG: helix-turn-helix domain-containing protein [Gammaproteobacteria bacterium]|nr:helix-turn-helix domain-containing protein [Gammaproteobacteria bacterium]MBU1732467.1 helix-turn-helix domain-containing protein [Gammaproteobacteria bacterium]MBU1891750.1 helix-turn-helix domain-containing protein [Gammaproteobacteria bacterium]
MDIQRAFAKALKAARTAKGLTQEDFSAVSSRTYLSTLERGLKNPTLEKIQDIAETMAIHPLTLLVLTYMQFDEKTSVESLFQRIQREVDQIGQG